MKKLKLIHGKGEITRISQQVKDAFKIIDGHDIRTFKDSRLVKKIENLGFEWASSSGVAFIGRTQVIKCALLTRRPPPISYRVPTLIYAYEEVRPTEWDWNYVVLIQPKTELSFDFRCKQDNKRYESFSKLSSCDAHSGNVGKYKGKLCLFDW